MDPPTLPPRPRTEAQVSANILRKSPVTRFAYSSSRRERAPALTLPDPRNVEESTIAVPLLTPVS
ncbi:hypothetical protein C8Q78DRAFT_557424 [Trametes maxima]|nr:hypothetical protein C8Q78DRAFT_557424 [Trametes maxima]